MEKIEEGKTACQKCGFINGTNTNESHLVHGTLLHERYLIGDAIGQGGFGITYIGYDQKLEMKVAIKEYYPISASIRDASKNTVRSLTSDRENTYQYGLEKFIEEAKILAKFNQKTAIVTVIDYFKANGTAYIVMEYLEGISLEEYLKNKGGKLSIKETIDVILPILDGLMAIHSEGIIHRDISPDNIYITNDNKIKLLDLGAARYAFNEKSSDMTVILKRGYAPAEQYSRQGNQGTWSDVYSVGATWYKMLTGTEMVEAMSRSIGEDYKLPSDLGVKISPALETVLKKSLSYQPNGRYQDINSFKNELVNAFNGKASNSAETEIIYNGDLYPQGSTKTKPQNKTKKRGIKVLMIPLIVISIIIMIGLFIIGKNFVDNLFTKDDKGGNEVVSTDQADEDQDNEDQTNTDEENISSSSDLETITLLEQDIQLAYGGVQQLTVSTNLDDSSGIVLVWASDKADIVSISDMGEITGQSAGEANITVSDETGQITATCHVTVLDAPVVEEITLNYATLEITEGDSVQLLATILPDNAYNQTLVWEVSDPTIATIDDQGNIQALAVGEALVIVTSENGVKSKCAITINKLLKLDILNFDIVNRNNLDASRQFTMSPDYIFFNDSGELIRSNIDGSDRVVLTDLISADSYVVRVNNDIYFSGLKEEELILYRIKIDGMNSATEIVKFSEVGAILGHTYSSNETSLKTQINSFQEYGGSIYFTYQQRYMNHNGYTSLRMYVLRYDPSSNDFSVEVKKEITDLPYKDTTTWYYFNRIGFSNGRVFYSDTKDTGFFMQELGGNSELLTTDNVGKFEANQTHCYYIDNDSNSLNRITLQGTMKTKLLDNVSYFTLTGFDEIIYSINNKIYIADIGFENSPKLIAEGFEEFMYAGEYLFYVTPDSTLMRVTIETGEELVIF